MSNIETLHIIRPTAAERDFDSEHTAAEWYVLLWSQSQNGFHIERHRHMLDANRRAYAEDRRMDYVPIFVGTHDFCCRMANCLRNTLRSRQAARESAKAALEKIRDRSARFHRDDPQADQRVQDMQNALVRLMAAEEARIAAARPADPEDDYLGLMQMDDLDSLRELDRYLRKLSGRTR